MPITTMPNFEYHVPKSIDEVLALLDTYGTAAKIIAGGTDLIPKMKGGVLAPEHIISLKDLPELRYIQYDEQSGLRFGAATTIKTLEDHPVVREKYQALFQGAHSMASTQIRNAGTVVGNICNAVPSADTAPALLILGATLKIQSAKGQRTVPIEEFFTGVCRTVLEPNELVTEVQIPALAENTGCVYYKYAIRRALDLAMVGVAAMVTVEDDVCTNARIALGAVAITPKRAMQAEAMLCGQKLTDELVDAVAVYASQNECSPITDMRATKEYRREIVRVLTRDAINQASGRKAAVGL